MILLPTTSPPGPVPVCRYNDTHTVSWHPAQGGPSPYSSSSSQEGYMPFAPSLRWQNSSAWHCFGCQRYLVDRDTWERSLNPLEMLQEVGWYQYAVKLLDRVMPFGMYYMMSAPLSWRKVSLWWQEIKILSDAGRAIDGESLKICCDLLREVVGNPWRTYEWHNSYLTINGCDVFKTALEIYSEDDMTGLPVLADACEDAGCTDRRILDHLRSPGPHVKGCWALDLILGKE